MAQFYAHILAIQQKLAFIRLPDLFGDKRESHDAYLVKPFLLLEELHQDHLVMECSILWQKS